jgi:hypothetical protein
MASYIIHSYLVLTTSVHCANIRYISSTQNSLLDVWADLGSTLGFQQNPANHRPFWRPEGNIVHIVHNEVSPEMDLWVTTGPRCLQSWKGGCCGDVRHSFYLNIHQIYILTHHYIQIYHSVFISFIKFILQ